MAVGGRLSQITLGDGRRLFAYACQRPQADAHACRQPKTTKSQSFSMLLLGMHRPKAAEDQSFSMLLLGLQDSVAVFAVLHPQCLVDPNNHTDSIL